MKHVNTVLAGWLAVLIVDISALSAVYAAWWLMTEQAPGWKGAIVALGGLLSFLLTWVGLWLIGALIVEEIERHEDDEEVVR